MAADANWKISLLSFLLGTSVILIPLVGLLNSSFQNGIAALWHYFFLCNILAVNAILVFKYQGHAYQVAIRGGALGLLFGLGLIISATDRPWRVFGWYAAVLSFFHWSEYFITAVTNPRSLTLSSYLLDHSREYHIAAVASWIEFWLEWMFFPGMKDILWLRYLGLAVVVAGEILRKGAMWTAKTNFNHYVQHVKQSSHVLVTHGLYSVCRHPSYVGWFYWSVGTQILLFNPVCAVAYAIASWKFFRYRIEDEEITLLNFFGEQYIDYQRKVGTGLPFIYGYRVEL